MMILVSTETGSPQLILLDNVYLADIRTAAAKYLAPNKITTVGIIGTGVQTRYQILALKQVRVLKILLFMVLRLSG